MSDAAALERARAQGWRLEGEPGVLATLAGLVLPDPEIALARSVVLRRTAQRTVVRLDLPGTGPLLAKMEVEGGVEDTIRRLFRPSRARSEWLAARWLRERGVRVPEPLALAERGGGLRTRTTLYVCRFLEDVQPLGTVLGGAGQEEARTLLARTGALVRRMHEAGFDHRDLHTGNVLVGPAPARDLVLIDLHRSRLAPPAPRDVCEALGRLLAFVTAPTLEEPAQVQALLEGWCGPQGGVEALARQVAPHVAAYRRARHAKHDAYALVEGPWYEAMPRPWRGVRDPAWPAARVEERLRAHDRMLAARAVGVLKDRPKSAVTRHGDVVVKETRLVGWRSALKRVLVPGRLVAGHVNAHRLRVRGIATARSLALVRGERRIFTLYEDLGRLPRLDDLVRTLYRPRGPRLAQVRLRDACADWLAGLHVRGVYHGDVKSLHVLVEERAGGPAFVLIDTDRLRLLDRPVSLRRRLKNLAQLDASIPVSVTRTERLRWWLRYAAALGAGDGLRDTSRRLARLLARKVRVVHDPLE